MKRVIIGEDCLTLCAVTLSIRFLFVTKLIKQAFMEPLTHSLVVSGVGRYFTRYASALSTIIWSPPCYSRLSKNLILVAKYTSFVCSFIESLQLESAPWYPVGLIKK